MLFKMVDTDNSGHLSLDEFKVLHEIIVKDEQARAANIKELDATVTRNRETIVRLRKVVLAAFLFSITNDHKHGRRSSCSYATYSSSSYGRSQRQHRFLKAC